MIDLSSWAEVLGLRRKKTFVERVQDVAEDVVDAVKDTVNPALGRSAMARVARMGTAVRNVDLPELRLPKMSAPDIHLPAMHMPSVHIPSVSMPSMPSRSAFPSMPSMNLPSMHLPDVRFPDIHPGELVSDAAARVRHGAVATADATVGVASGIGGFLGTVVSGLWSLTTLLVKAAVLLGTAYAGWQWLQSRKTQQGWDGSPGATDTPNYASTVYGTVSPQPAIAP